MKRAPRSLQHHVLYRKYNGQDSEISALLGKCGIKLEAPEGDLMRAIGGPSHTGALSGKFMHFNRSKRFICIDLKKPDAARVLKKLLQHVDVVVSNMRPDAMERLGIDAAGCEAANPAIIHCTISGFGPDGPYRGLPAYDSVLQGVCGIAGLNTRKLGAPHYVPFLAIDHVVGEITAGAVCAALFRRARTGKGSSIEVPMHETMSAFVLKEHLSARTFSPPLGPSGDQRVLDPLSAPAQTADGWISIAANTNAQAHSFLRAIEREDLLEDPRFVSVQTRYRHASEWFDLRKELRHKTTAHWLKVLRAVDVPAMPCHDLDSLPDDPHLQAVALMSDVEHPLEGQVATIRSSVLIDGTTQRPDTQAMPMGWHTLTILAELGFSSDQIAALLRDAVVKDGQPQENN